MRRRERIDVRSDGFRLPVVFVVGDCIGGRVELINLAASGELKRKVFGSCSSRDGHRARLAATRPRVQRHLALRWIDARKPTRPDARPASGA